EMLKKLNGMFAFAIWDTQKQQLFIARDHAGIKPLYYYSSGGTLIFGSEIKTILNHPGVPKNMNRTSFDLYSFFGYIPGQESIFEGIHKLQPGHYLTFSTKGLQITKYYDLESLSTPNSDTLDTLFDNSLKLQSIADVPLGVLLSGGLDSSLIAYYLTRQKHNVKSFSISFSEKSFDESTYAKQVSDILGTHHHEEQFSAENLIDIFPKIVQKLDEPLADPSLFPTFAVSALARKHVKVALSGDGGDELFAGYPTYQGHFLANLIPKLPSPVISSWINTLNKFNTSTQNYPTLEVLINGMSGLDKGPIERQLTWMSNQSVGLTKSKDIRSNSVYQTLLQTPFDPKHILRSVQKLDFATYLEGDLLVKSDRASMFNSLELRVPFLDLDLISYAYTTQSPHADFFTTKSQLRRLLRQKLPKDLLDRGSNFFGVKLFRKKGFGIPLFKWMTTDLRPLVEDHLSNQGLSEHFDMQRVRSLWDRTLSGQANHSKLIWMVVMFSAWQREWLRS
ncbi:MAG: asparagine synthase (glutamine-hydrolyzing), partial [Patescibacteria group bacterium]